MIFVFLFLLILLNSVKHYNQVMLEEKKKLKEKISDAKDSNNDFIVEKKEDFIVENVTRVCPPHKWRYQEVRDTEGKTVRWRIICDLCGPLKPMGGPARLE